MSRKPTSTRRAALPPEGFLSAADVAQLLGVRPRTIYTWHDEGLLRGYRLGKRLLRFDAADVRAFLDAGVRQESQ